jgi:hypothetical protein
MDEVFECGQFLQPRIRHLRRDQAEVQHRLGALRRRLYDVEGEAKKLASAERHRVRLAESGSLGGKSYYRKLTNPLSGFRVLFRRVLLKMPHPKGLYSWLGLTR